ncbi:phospholipase B1, membrane-associated-like [Lasioglossum baleicum]|uniref:phospholipase B1, membrane-associated-like n=1 Tax=Lasioglossum baleicum TaxID=434251 RepID=UPI003FCDD4D3
MRGLRFLLILHLCTLLGAQRTDLDNPFLLQLYGRVRSFLFRTFVNRAETRRNDDGSSATSFQDEVPPDVPFPCNVTGGRSSQVPTSVNSLRPGDIDVIGGIGDSLTAGNAISAKNFFELGIESRGLSGSSGGQGTWRTYTTLPNILKEYNPNLIGYALGDSYVNHRASQFDVAEAGGMSRDMPFMAEYLINRLRKDPRVDIKKNWKMITIMIGSNDFCVNICDVPSPWSILDDHKKDLVKTLRILRDNLPRTIVALILPPRLQTLVEAHDNTSILKCYLLTRFECPCLFTLQFRHMRDEYYEIMERWVHLEETIADNPEFHTDDFTVVPLPSLQGTTFPKCKDGNADPSFFAFDCFHVTQKSNALYANALWNNLLEPYDNKTHGWKPLFKKFLCPTPDRPFLMTRGNSRRSNDL